MAIALPMNVAVGANRTRARYMPHRVLPGFGLTLGFTVLYLGLFVLIPLSTIFVKAGGLGWDGFWTTVTAQRVMAEDCGGGAGQPENAEKYRPQQAYLKQAADYQQRQRARRRGLDNGEIFGVAARPPPGSIQTEEGKDHMPQQQQGRKQDEVPHGKPQRQKLRQRVGAGLAQARHRRQQR